MLSPTGYDYVHGPHLNVWGGGMAAVYANAQGLNQKTVYKFTSYEAPFRN